jgi:hypothetical protein
MPGKTMSDKRAFGTFNSAERIRRAIEDMLKTLEPKNNTSRAITTRLGIKQQVNTAGHKEGTCRLFASSLGCPQPPIKVNNVSRTIRTRAGNRSSV